MELPIDLLKQLDEWVGTLDDGLAITKREIAIEEAARLLIYLTNDEYSNNLDAFDKSYDTIADTCRFFAKLL